MGRPGKRSTAWRMSGSPRSSRSKTAATSAASTTSVTSDGRVDPPVADQAHERAHQPRLVPAGAEPDRRAGDLAGHDPHPVVVELLAEPQVGRAALVEAGGHDRAVDDDRADRLVQRPVAAADLDGGVDAAARPLADDGSGAALGVGGHGVGRAHRSAAASAAGAACRRRPPRRPAIAASRVASRPITPCPNTATLSPTRTSPASTALRAIEPTRANVPEIASSSPDHVRQATASAATTASLRWPQIPCTTSPTAGAVTPSATSTTSPTSE